MAKAVVESGNQAPVYVPQSTINSQIPKAGRTGVTTTPPKPTAPKTTTTPTVTPTVTPVTPTIAPTVTPTVTPTVAPAVTGGITATNNTYVDANGNQMVVMSDGSVKNLGQSQTGAATSTTRQNAFDLLKQQFTDFGVLKKDGSGNYDSASQGLLDTVKSLIMSGAGPDTASLTLQQSPAYQARFSGNTARVAAGLSVLTPAEYLATENSYDQVLKAAGFPAGYNTQAKFAQFIGNDMSPTELTDRVATAAKSVANNDPYYTETLKNYYGLSSGDMIAHALDPQATLPLLQRQQAAASFGTAADRQGLNVASNVAEQYGALGVTQSQAEAGFQNIGTQLPEDQKLAQIYGGQFGTPNDQQALLQSATFGGTDAAQAQLQLKKLQQQETNAFSGSAGVAKGSLQGDQGGTF